jgi:hypothetical protein
MTPTPRRFLWLKHRPPLQINPLHFRTRSDVEEYLGNVELECLECGKRFRKLGTHVTRTHRMAVSEYCDKYGLPRSRGLVGVETKRLIAANFAPHQVAGKGISAARKAPRRTRPATYLLLEQQRAARVRPRKGSRWTS